MQPLLQGGRRKRRLGARIALAALMLAPFAVGAAGYVALQRDGNAAVSLAAGASADALRAERPAEPERPPDLRLSGVDAFHVRLRPPPRAALVFDVDDGEVLWRLRPLTPRPMASLTKIMSALLVTEYGRPRERVKITRAALRYQGSGVGVLPRGKRVRLEALLHGMLLVSGNDASIALAVHVAGSHRRFVRLMNDRARELGLNCTRFASSHGLESGNRSCPRDLAVMTRLAMRSSRIVRIARMRRARFRFPIKGGWLDLYGHNPLIRMGYRGALGLKTGYTSDAGRCFVGVARRRGRTLGVVLLDSPDPGGQAKRLLDLGFRRG